MDLDKIHDDLIQVQLPSTLKDLKNPTEEYVMNLLMQFLNKFCIDLNAIRKPTSDQLMTISLAEDNTEVISLINLTQAMAGICNELFLKDFYLSDLTCPTSKRTRMLAKVLSNFVLYALNKMQIIEKRVEEMRCQHEILIDLREQRNALIEHKNQKVLENVKKLERKEQLEAEIIRMKALRGERKARLADVQERLKKVQEEKLKIAQYCGNLTNEAMKMRKKTEDLESKLVRSPERIQSRLREVMEQKKNWTEKRAVIQEAIQSKQPAMEKIERHLSFVRDQHAKLSEVSEAYKQLTNMKKVMKESAQKVAEIRSVVELESTTPGQKDGQPSCAILEETKDTCDQQLCSVRNELAELLNMKNSMEEKLEDAQSQRQNIYSERDEIRVSIQQAENEYMHFVATCQELYDKEVNQERKMKNKWRG